MNEEPGSSERHQVVEDETKRRTYSPPVVLESAEFETLALSCGKQSGPECTFAGGTSSS